MYAVIDRFEGIYAVCETDDRKWINIEQRQIPSGAKEGDVLDLAGPIRIDHKETLRRKDEIKALLRCLSDENE